MLISLPRHLVAVQKMASLVSMFCKKLSSFTSDWLKELMSQLAGQKRTGRDFCSQSESLRNRRAEKDRAGGKERRGGDHGDEPRGFALRSE